MKNNNTIIPIILVVILSLCCCLILTLGGIAYSVYRLGKNLPTLEPFFPIEITATPFDITRQPPAEDITDTLYRLELTVIPERDLALLACRFQGICNISETLDPPVIPYTIGSERQFWLSNNDTGVYSQITATLEYLTNHAYFWVENGVTFNQNEAENLIDTFEKQIYPTNRAFFGSEWTPGVDNDPHIYIIYARNLGTYVAGYYVSLDEYNPLVVEHSNGIEAFYIDSSQDLGNEYTYSTLAHEFQHMIHWYQDANESSFLDEGFSELASFLNNYNPGGLDYYYTSDPDIALTDWQETEENSAHYGANFLFVTYFLDRFGDQATQTLVRDQQNELESVDNTIQSLGIIDSLTGKVITADDFFLDWVITNYIHDPAASDGRYFYYNYPDSPITNDTEWISTCPQTGLTRTVNQYGVDYIRITCPGDSIISFSGTTLTPLLSDDPHSGKYAFWSHKSNESNTTLSREFDLSAVTGSATLTYWTWFDLETNFDFVYLEASTDGVNWEILITPSGTAENPTGSAYGWGYTGQSGGWIQESVDLSQYVGKLVYIRFDYITDAAIVQQGFMLDDLAIPEIGYSEDFETDDGEWEAAGFVRIQNILPQSFRLAVIHYTGDDTNVQIIPPSPDQSVEILITISNGDSAVLVVTATTRYTLEPAPYQLDIR